MESPSQIPGAGGPAQGPASPAGIPSPELASLIARKARGEKLTSQEYGKLGGYYRKRSSPAPLAPSAPAPSRLELLRDAGAVDRPEAPAPLPAAPPVDPQLVKDTTAAILSAIDGVTCRWFAAEATKLGSDKESTSLLVEEVKLQDSQRAIMVETSPAVIQSLGIDSQNYPIAAFCVGLVTWILGIFGGVAGLRRLKTETQNERTAPRSQLHPDSETP